MKNKVILIDCNTAGIIINYKGKELVSYIDLEDLPLVEKFPTTWHINKNASGHIDGVRTKVQKEGVRKQYWLHNIIMPKKISKNVIDHIDHDTLNNTKRNLREISSKENAQNVSFHRNNTTGCSNVYFEKGKYRVRIKGMSFGRYDTLEEARIIAQDKQKQILPFRSELNNKITNI